MNLSCESNHTGKVVFTTLVSTSNFEVEANVHLHHLNFHLVEMNFGLFLMPDPLVC